METVNQKFPRKKTTVIAASIILAAFAFGGYKTWAGGNQPTPAKSLLDTSKVVATVNGVDIREAEILPLIASGVDRANAIDQTVTKALLSQGANREFSEDAQLAAAVATREALAQVYLAKKSSMLAKAMPDEKIRDYYDRNVVDADYKKVKLRYYLTQDAEDAAKVFSAAAKKDKDALAKFDLAKKDGDHLLSLNEVPYGLGQLVKKAEAGAVLDPVNVRNGIMILVVDDIKPGAKPSLDSAKDAIRQILVNEQMGSVLAEQRKAARIELKG